MLNICESYVAGGLQWVYMETKVSRRETGCSMVLLYYNDLSLGWGFFFGYVTGIGDSC